MNAVTRPKTNRRRLLTAIAGIAMAGSVYMMCPRDAGRSLSQGATAISQAEKNKDDRPIREGPSIQKMLAKAKEGIEQKPDPLLKKLTDAIPYESLDCSMEEVKDAKVREYSSNALRELFGSVHSILLGSLSELSVMSDIHSRYYCFSQTSDSFSCFDDPLMSEMAELRHSKNPQELIAIVNHIDSLDLIGEDDGEIRTLYNEYTMMKADADFGISSFSPDIPCLERQAYATRLTILAEILLIDTLSDMITENPSSLSVLDTLSQDRREKIIQESTRILERGSDETEDFFHLLYGSNKENFLKFLSSGIKYGFPDAALKITEDIAQRTADPQLKETLMDALSLRKGFAPLEAIENFNASDFEDLPGSGEDTTESENPDDAY